MYVQQFEFTPSDANLDTIVFNISVLYIINNTKRILGSFPGTKYDDKVETLEMFIIEEGGRMVHFQLVFAV